MIHWWSRNFDISYFEHKGNYYYILYIYRSTDECKRFWLIFYINSATKICCPKKLGEKSNRIRFIFAFQRFNDGEKLSINKNVHQKNWKRSEILPNSFDRPRNSWIMDSIDPTYYIENQQCWTQEVSSLTNSTISFCEVLKKDYWQIGKDR